MSSSTLSTTDNAAPSRLEAWVVKNSGRLALGIIALAFVIRLVYASSCYLNIDEAAHFDLARPSSWLGAYEASLKIWHPPLFILVLHALLFLGRSELILRLPSLIGGTAALWFIFAWMRDSLGEIPALAGLGFMAISSAAISASTEVRQYGLLLFFICAALYATERTFTERSMNWAICQGLMLLGALLTHYTALVVLASLGLYVLLRALLDRVPRRIFVAFVLTQLVLAAVLGWLYSGHIQGLIPSGAGAKTYLGTYYYGEARETPLAFVWKALSLTFAYLTGARRLAVLFMLAFLAGIAALIAGRTKAPKLLPLLVISPFVVGFAAATVKVFPFAGSRHQTYLLPFLAAGLSAGLAWLPRRRAVTVLLLCAVVAPPLWVFGTTPENNLRVMPKRDMTAAIEYVRRTIPQGSPLFVDYDTRDVLSYYLARNDASLDTLHSRPVLEERLGGYRVIVPGIHSAAFRPEDALQQVAESARTLGVPPGDPLWVVSVSWVWIPSLASRLPAGGDIETKEFGRISVIKLSNWDRAQVSENSSSTQPAIDGFHPAAVSRQDSQRRNEMGSCATLDNFVTAQAPKFTEDSTSRGKQFNSNDMESASIRRFQYSLESGLGARLLLDPSRWDVSPPLL
jgi:Dolichyl-phosphate-mannose-protein mannosyltransferase